MTWRYCPWRTRPTVSTDGVALPSTTAAPASRARASGSVSGLEPGSPVALVGCVVLLVDHDETDVGEWRGHGQSRSHNHVDLPGLDASPFVGTLAGAQARVEDRQLGLQLHAKPVDQGHGQGYLRHQNEGGPAGRYDLRDSLRVDSGLAGPGDALEEQRSGVAPGGRGHDRRQGLLLGPGQGRPLGTRAPPARPAPRQRPARPLPDFDHRKAAPDQACHGTGSVASGRLRGYDAPRFVDGLRPARLATHRHGRGGRQVRQQGLLPRPHAGAGRRLTGLGHSPPLVCEQHPPLEARPRRRRQQPPLEVDQTARCHSPEIPQQSRTPLAGFQIPNRPRAPGEPVSDARLGRAKRRLGLRRGDRSSGSLRAGLTFVAGAGVVAPSHRQPLSHQLEALQHPGGHHRPHDGGRRSEVLRRDPAREIQCQTWEERTAGVDPGQQGLELDADDIRRRPEHDAEGLPFAELDQHRLPGLYGNQPRGHGVVVGPRRPGCVDRNFYGRLPVGRVPADNGRVCEQRQLHGGLDPLRHQASTPTTGPRLAPMGLLRRSPVREIRAVPRAR